MHAQGHHTDTQTLPGIVLIGVPNCKQQKTTVADSSRKGIHGKDKSLTYRLIGSSPGLYAEGRANFIKIKWEAQVALHFA